MSVTGPVTDDELIEMIARCRRRMEPGHFERYGLDLPGESAATLRALEELQQRRRDAAAKVLS